MKFSMSLLSFMRADSVVVLPDAMELTMRQRRKPLRVVVLSTLPMIRL
jgi:hypothetical protein